MASDPEKHVVKPQKEYVHVTTDVPFIDTLAGE